MRNDGQVELGFAFGPFLFDLRQRVLLCGGRQRPLGSRAREILVLLLERAGETVPKRELMRHVWPHTLVEEGTLRVHIACLRKVLGEGKAGGSRYVENITGFGYRFMAPVTRVQPGTVRAVHGGEMAGARLLPAPVTRMVGRGQVVSSVLAGLAGKRLMTVVGPGGIGKTAVAVAVADQVDGLYPDGVHFIDLQSINAPELVCTTVASVLGLTTADGDPCTSLLMFLRSKHLLLVLDGCEHVIDAVARLVGSLLGGAPHIHIVATSREPLRVRSEWVVRLAPLDVPERGSPLSAAEALTFPAIQLFVERARASLHTFQLGDGEASTVAEICHRLDGLPLAIELAAAKVHPFGVRGLASRLDDCLGLLTQGPRTAVPRHQTLRATLDWSYATLAPTEQQVLTRLAAFAGAFTAPAAAAVAAEGDSDTGGIVEVLSNLAAKSLLTGEVTGEHTCYRLLNSSRAYALERLESDGEGATIRRRHIQLCLRWVAEAARDPAGGGACLECLRRRLGDVRAALDWCFCGPGDRVLGLTLLASSAALWFQLSQHTEYLIRVQQALRVLSDAAPGDVSLEQQLREAMGEALVCTQGGGEEVRTAYQKILCWPGSRVPCPLIGAPCGAFAWTG